MQGYKKLLLLTGLAVILFSTAKGQNTDSPYSRYGYGVLNDQAIGASKGMGGISYGVRGLSVNPGNPASYSSVDSLTFIFDIGANYTKTKLSDTSNSRSKDNGGLDYLAFQFSLANKLGMSIGMLPYSQIGYSYGNVQKGQDGLISVDSYTGSGGYSQIYGGLGYEFIKGVSVGANVSYLFGNSYYTSKLESNVAGSYTRRKITELRLELLKLDFGAQYSLALNKKNQLVLGAVFSPKINNTGKISQFNALSTISGGGEYLVEGDTLTYRGSNANADLPMTVGGGFTFTHNNNLTLGGDVTYQQWSKVKYSSHMDDGMTAGNRFKDSWRINGGIEYTIAPNERSLFKRLRWRAGAKFSNSYLNVTNDKGQVGGFKSYGATLGIGIPIRDQNFSPRTSFMNISFEYSKLSPNIDRLVKEEYFGISVNMNINELWFFKRKLQ